MGAWSPSRMPRIRDQMVRLLSDDEQPLRRNIAKLALRAAFDRYAAALRAGELWWVAPDMAALAISAAADLPEEIRIAPLAPAPSGLLIWDGGVGQIDYEGALLTVDAISWGPSSHGLETVVWIRTSRVEQKLAEKGMTGAVGSVAPLIPAAALFAHEEEPGSLGWMPVSTLAAAWLLMDQPKIISRTRIDIDRQLRRAYGRAQRPQPEVTLMDLRRLYRPDLGEEPGDSGRTYHYRWVVRGHWRQQAHGPSHSLRRITWVPAYVKGPDGAPLLQRERVNIWRR